MWFVVVLLFAVVAAQVSKFYLNFIYVLFRMSVSFKHSFSYKLMTFIH